MHEEGCNCLSGVRFMDYRLGGGGMGEWAASLRWMRRGDLEFMPLGEYDHVLTWVLNLAGAVYVICGLLLYLAISSHNFNLLYNK